MMNARLTPLVFFFCLVVAACTPEPASDTQEAPGATTTPPTTQVSLASAEHLGVRNARMPIEGLVTAAQPTQEQMDGLSEAGFQHFISLRLPGEDGAGWEEAYTAEGGPDFARLPITGEDALTRENVDALAELLDATGGEPTVLYCGSSNRVGALLALKAHWVDGASPEDAFELGQQAGMTGLTEPVRALLGLAPQGSP